MHMIISLHTFVQSPQPVDLPNMFYELIFALGITSYVIKSEDILVSATCYNHMHF